MAGSISKSPQLAPHQIILKPTDHIHRRPRFFFYIKSSASNTDDLTLSQGQGPSCVLLGAPLDTATKENIEALYRQARNAYYSGKPIIKDDLFDKLELKLRWYGSKSVVKYPRCSLRRQSTYADAEEDPPQAFALASIWILILTLGSSACLLPIMQAAGIAYEHLYDSGISYSHHNAFTLDFLQSRVNNIIFIVLGSLIGYPVTSASVGVLKGLWRNDLVALKGSCPNCGEEVFAFVRSDQSNSSPHKATCHVCDSSLEFRTKVEQSISRLGRRWVHGRVYLV
ncbi:hypothetical protein QQ045_025810 [Rhodiola kirilowii]